MHNFCYTAGAENTCIYPENVGKPDTIQMGGNGVIGPHKVAMEAYILQGCFWLTEQKTDIQRSCLRAMSVQIKGCKILCFFYFYSSNKCYFEVASFLKEPVLSRTEACDSSWWTRFSPRYVYWFIYLKYFCATFQSAVQGSLQAN